LKIQDSFFHFSTQPATQQSTTNREHTHHNRSTANPPNAIKLKNKKKISNRKISKPNETNYRQNTPPLSSIISMTSPLLGASFIPLDFFQTYPLLVLQVLFSFFFLNLFWDIWMLSVKRSSTSFFISSQLKLSTATVHKNWETDRGKRRCDKRGGRSWKRKEKR
jgi:hypothetical protein